jgi:hypothetical protein
VCVCVCAGGERAGGGGREEEELAHEKETVPFGEHGFVVRDEPPFVILASQGYLMHIARRAVWVEG